MHPMINTTDELKMMDHTGTSSFGCIFPSHLLPRNVLSLARDQVRREAVSCAPVRAKQAAQKRSITKTVAAASEWVACIHIS